MYVSNQDRHQIDAFSNRLINHFLSSIPVTYRNAEVKIYNASSVSFPQKNLNTALIVPFDTTINPTKSWLNAYDLLSTAEYSYTTDYDNSPNLFSYQTIVLSTDPPSNNRIEQTFQDNFSTQKNWKQLSGIWQYWDGGIEAGIEAIDSGNYQDSILLSPISALNFTASVNFKPLYGDTKVEIMCL